MNFKSAQTMIVLAGIVLFFPSQARAAELKLEAEKTSFAVGETIHVNVNLSGKEETVGTDLVLTYDPKAVQVVGIDDNQLYPVYNPPASSRVNASMGTIKLSGSANFGKPVMADGTFAMVKLKALAPGSATLSISFKKGNTTLSGVLGKNGQELLSAAPKPLTLTITGEDLKQAKKTLGSNASAGFFQTVVSSVVAFFKSLFSWVK